jgi:hypothetical protein
MVVADGGGGGGDLSVDYSALARAGTVLTEAGSHLDACGSTAPASGDTGDAAALIAAMFSGFADSAGKLVGEASVLGAAVQVCSSGLASTDAEQAVAVLRGGS